MGLKPITSVLHRFITPAFLPLIRTLPQATPMVLAIFIEVSDKPLTVLT
jgi:hypothetical protein